MTPGDYRSGFAICPCGKFAHVHKAAVLRQLPKHYSGELCGACRMWMCSTQLLREAGYEIPCEPEQADTNTKGSTE